MWSMMKIEMKKYRGVPLFRVLSLAVVLTLLVCVMPLFRDSKGMSDVLKFYTVLDSAAFFNVILLPTILAGLASMGVQLEARHNMWKVLVSRGVQYKRLYGVKFFYLYACYLIAQLVEWGLLILLLTWRGLAGYIPWDKCLFYGASVLVISGFILLIHYLLSLKWSNQLISLSVAIFGSLMGIIITLISKSAMRFVPYSWYGFLMSLRFEKIGDHFVRHVGDMSYFPLIAALFLGTVLYQLGKRMKVGE